MRLGRTKSTLTALGTPPRRRTRRLPIALLLVPLLTGLFAAPTSRVAGDDLADAVARQKALQRQIAQQKNQVSQLTELQGELKGEIAQTARALAGINADLGAVRAQIAKMVKRIDQVKTQYLALVEQVKVLDVQLASVVAQEAAKRRELGERRALLAQRLREAYDTDRTSLLETFLSGGSFADVLSEVSYYLDVGDQDRVLAEQITKDQETLSALHQTVADTRVETNLLRQQTAAQKRELDKELRDLKHAQAQLKALEKQTARALAVQKAAYARLARNKSALKKSMSQAAAAQRALARKIEQLVQEQLSQGRIPSKYNGSLSWPMVGTVTQNFGCTGFSWEPPLGSCAHFHRGIDIAAPMYTPIHAAGPGTVVFAGPNPYDSYPKAWIVIIAHSANLQTWYAHLDNAVHPPAVHAGQSVRKGQTIAYEGMTGRTTGPHLHWMVELNGDFVNPRLFL